MLQRVVCPISTETYETRAARLGAILTAALLGAYVATGRWPILAFVILDYLLRVLTPWTPPIAVAARILRQGLRLTPQSANRGPKIFAWRIGLLFAVTAGALAALAPAASRGVALALAGFNVLDGLCNVCLGCVVYTYLVLPLFGPRPAVEP